MTHPKHGASAGAVALRRTGATQAAIAERLGVDRSLVAYWGTGRRKPGPAHREALEEHYSIAPELWDLAPEEAAGRPPASPAKRAPALSAAPRASSPSPKPLGRRPKAAAAPAEPVPLTPATVRDRAAQLQADVEDLLASIRADAGATPLERAKVMASAAGTLQLLGKMTGETGEVSEAKIVSSPAWRRLVERLLEALEPYPDAMRAAGEALREGA